MPRSKQEKLSLIQVILSDHEAYWQEKSGTLRRYRDAYRTQFYRDDRLVDGQLRVETADSFAYIEGYMSSLFSKSPAVEVESAYAGQEAKATTRTVVNSFLYDKRNPIENASRMALIYPMAFLKLAPQESDDVLNRVSIRACEPWTVIVDREASCWDDQRYVGHVYWISGASAKEKFGAKDFKFVNKIEYFDGQNPVTALNQSPDSLPSDLKYIKVVEFYDLGEDKVYYWSPQYSDGNKLIDEDNIPVRTYDDQPLPGIAPLYYSRIPDSPLEGYSAMSRVYDQFFEKNEVRTFLANAIRRDSRQYLYKQGLVDEDELAKITAGVDGAMIGVETEGSLDSVIRAIPVAPMTTNFDRYMGMIESDIQRGSSMAPFTRGEATRSTATEVAVMAAYSASEIGRLARERDFAIEKVSDIYIRMLSLLLDDDEKAVILVDGRPEVVQPEDFDYKFKFAAVDQAATPMSTALRNQEFINLIPVLQGMGVEAGKIRDHLIKVFSLPEEFLSENDAPPEPPPEAAGAGGAGLGALAGLGAAPGPTGLSEAEQIAADVEGRQIDPGVPLP